jgi:hypothetical protein
MAMTSGSGLSGEFNGRAPVAGAALDADALLVRGDSGAIAELDRFFDGNDMVRSFRGGSRSANSDAQTQAQREKKEREERQFLQLIEDLQRQIHIWREEQSKNNEELAKNNEALEAINDLETLIAKGKFDPNNPVHKQLLQKAGIDKNTRPEDVEEALKKKQLELLTRNEWLQKRNAELQAKIDHNEILINDLRSGRALETSNGRFIDPTMEGARVTYERETGKSADPEKGLSPEAEKGISKILTRENMDSVDAAVALVEQNENVINKDVEELKGVEANTVSTEDQVNKFMSEIKDAQKIDDPRARLIREKEIFQSLSTQAKEHLELSSEDPEILKKLDPDYFVALDQPSRPLPTVQFSV